MNLFNCSHLYTVINEFDVKKRMHVIVFSVPDASTMPTNLEAVIINSTSATLRWTFNRDVIGAVPTTLNGEFKGFKVQYLLTIVFTFREPTLSFVTLSSVFGVFFSDMK